METMSMCPKQKPNTRIWGSVGSFAGLMNMVYSLNYSVEYAAIALVATCETSGSSFGGVVLRYGGGWGRRRRK
jgi:hypothetical protein